MITLFASIAGFISSIFPEIFKILRDKQDKKHELLLLEKQIEMHKSGVNTRLEEIGYDADQSEIRALYETYHTGISWVDAFNGTVRPVLAYAFFILYSGVKLMQFTAIINEPDFGSFISILWTTEDQAIFAGIISFYYGQRSINKFKRNLK